MPGEVGAAGDGEGERGRRGQSPARGGGEGRRVDRAALVVEGDEGAVEAASQRAERRRPLCTSRRRAWAQSAQGTMWDARISSGSAMPVIGQRPFQ